MHFLKAAIKDASVLAVRLSRHILNGLAGEYDKIYLLIPFTQKQADGRD
jgi:hypothetical protein